MAKQPVGTMADQDLRAMSVRCPLCASAPQQPCYNERGKVNPVPHVARIDALLRIEASYINPARVTPTSQYHVTGVQPEQPKQPDLSVQNEGSIFLLRQHSAVGRDWMNEHIAITEETQTWGDAVVVEHRYIQDIIEGARRDGLTVGAA